ncbi:MAG: 30S ribosome-binding factor RbfA [Candidatus Omnitrophica bacterium]|nr:30S ribosome-binding factor RbfA [Candidatus Omnitrophota bacterium]
MSVRIEKVNSEIKKRIIEIITEEIDDPHLGLLSITRVETTKDLRESKIYFSVLDNNFPIALNILNKMKNFIRFHLGKKIRLKILPELIFVSDDSIKYTVEICKKIDEVMGKDNNF